MTKSRFARTDRICKQVGFFCATGAMVLLAILLLHGWLTKALGQTPDLIIVSAMTKSIFFFALLAAALAIVRKVVLAPLVIGQR
jgi:hypothetical protein